MMPSLCFTRLHGERGGKKASRLLCSVYEGLFMGGMRLNGVPKSVVQLREKCVSERRTATDRMYTNDVTFGCCEK